MAQAHRPPPRKFGFPGRPAPAAAVLGSGDRLVAAYREGLVKWDAVVHGVTLALGHAPPFPLFKGGPLVHELGELLDALETKKIPVEMAQPQFKTLRDLARALHYDAEPIFTSLFDLIERQISKGALSYVENAVQDLRELIEMVGSGQGRSPRALQLHAATFHQRMHLKKVIEELSTFERLTAYLLLGQALDRPR